MKLLRIRNPNTTDAKVRWSTANHEHEFHILKAEYRTTLLVNVDHLEAISVPYGTSIEVSEDGQSWVVLQHAAPKGELGP